jgi:hypothetical protein
MFEPNRFYGHDNTEASATHEAARRDSLTSVRIFE